MNIRHVSGLAASLACRGLLPKDKLQQITNAAMNENKALVSYLVDNKFISSEALRLFCEMEYGLAVFEPESLNSAALPAQYFDETLLNKYHVLPLYIQQNTLYIALSDPTNIEALEAFSFRFSMRAEALLVDEDFLSQTLNTLLDNKAFAQATLRIEGLDSADKPLTEQREPIQAQDEGSVINDINRLLINAVRSGASDLHFEPYEKTYRIRFRIDGILQLVSTPPVALSARFSARLKVMAKLDIAERRLPQDGRMRLHLSKGHSIDIRVSTLPTIYGEKVVMRILDPLAAHFNIDALGCTCAQQQQYLNALAKPQGMILITGPTGCGKTMSLYTGLSIINSVQRNISTAEDPVEINLTGINQVQINNKAGLTFASALRAFLRQDPDVIMVGEIRDLETAEIAIKAAQTGHLVLSTLHTNSAAETLVRLLNMGIPAFNVVASVSLIIAQRLVRRLCKQCKVAEVYNDAELCRLGFTTEQIKQGLTLYKPVGCEHCNEGYKGRIGTYEMLVLDSDIAELILQGGNALQIAALAQQQGMDSLRQSALQHAISGITSLHEVTRIT